MGEAQTGGTGVSPVSVEEKKRKLLLATAINIHDFAGTTGHERPRSFAGPVDGRHEPPYSCLRSAGVPPVMRGLVGKYGYMFGKQPAALRAGNVHEKITRETPAIREIRSENPGRGL
jgi:hypothetical protein